MFTGTATPKLELPQWEPTDHPDFLTDINTAFQKIDENAGATEESVEEIAEIRDNVSDLQALTQSLNEDSQEMLGEIAAINVALGNLRTETDKVEPIKAQVLGLQEIARRQSDEIHKLNNILCIRQVWNGSVTATVDNMHVTVTQVALAGTELRILAKAKLGDTFTRSANFIFDDPSIKETISKYRKNVDSMYTMTSLLLINDNGGVIGELSWSGFNSDDNLILSYNHYHNGSKYGQSGNITAHYFRKEE